MAKMLRRVKPSSTVVTVTAAPLRRGPFKKEPKVITILPVPSSEGGNTNYAEVVARYMKKIKNPKTAIRAKCVECSGGSLKEVNECRVFTCALYPFRLGENPFHKRTIDRIAREGEQDSEDDDEDSEE